MPIRSPAGFRFTLRGMGLAILALCAMLAAAKLLIDAARDARRAAIATTAQSPLNQLALALHNYHDVYGQFPPAYVTDAQGRPMHSWRVLLLPYVEQQALYRAYDFAEPWDGPNNSRLADLMPEIYRSPSEPHSSRCTNRVVVVGPETAFPGARSTRAADFADGLENTILLTEAADSDIVWLEPRDLNVATMSFTVQDHGRPAISSAPWRRPYVVFGDGIRAFGLDGGLPPSALRALTTIAGGEPVTRAQLQTQGHLR